MASTSASTRMTEDTIVLHMPATHARAHGTQYLVRERIAWSKIILRQMLVTDDSATHGLIVMYTSLGYTTSFLTVK